MSVAHVFLPTLAVDDPDAQSMAKEALLRMGDVDLSTLKFIGQRIENVGGHAVVGIKYQAQVTPRG